MIPTGIWVARSMIILALGAIEVPRTMTDISIVYTRTTAIILTGLERITC